MCRRRPCARARARARGLRARGRRRARSQSPRAARRAPGRGTAATRRMREACASPYSSRLIQPWSDATARRVGALARRGSRGAARWPARRRSRSRPARRRRCARSSRARSPGRARRAASALAIPWPPSCVHRQVRRWHPRVGQSKHKRGPRVVARLCASACDSGVVPTPATRERPRSPWSRSRGAIAAANAIEPSWSTYVKRCDFGARRGGVAGVTSPATVHHRRPRPPRARARSHTSRTRLRRRARRRGRARVSNAMRNRSGRVWPGASSARPRRRVGARVDVLAGRERERAPPRAARAGASPRPSTAHPRESVVRDRDRRGAGAGERSVQNVRHDDGRLALTPPLRRPRRRNARPAPHALAGPQHPRRRPRTVDDVARLATEHERRGRRPRPYISPCAATGSGGGGRRRRPTIRSVCVRAWRVHAGRARGQRGARPPGLTTDTFCNPAQRRPAVDPRAAARPARRPRGAPDDAPRRPSSLAWRADEILRSAMMECARTSSGLSSSSVLPPGNGPRTSHSARSTGCSDARAKASSTRKIIRRAARRAAREWARSRQKR